MDKFFAAGQRGRMEGNMVALRTAVNERSLQHGARLLAEIPSDVHSRLADDANHVFHELVEKVLSGGSEHVRVYYFETSLNRDVYHEEHLPLFLCYLLSRIGIRVTPSQQFPIIGYNEETPHARFVSVRRSELELALRMM